MAIKKNIKADANVVIGDGDQSKMFPEGYRYMVGGEEFTIVKRIVTDNTEIRMQQSSSGPLETLTVTTLLKDSKDPSFIELDPGKKKNN